MSDLRNINSFENVRAENIKTFTIENSKGTKLIVTNFGAAVLKNKKPNDFLVPIILLCKNLDIEKR